MSTTLPGNEISVSAECPNREAERVVLRLPSAAKLLLIGGEPFAEDILLWWNFIGRSQEEIERYVKQWNSGEAFGEVKGYPGERLLAPELPATMRLKS